MLKHRSNDLPRSQGQGRKGEERRERGTVTKRRGGNEGVERRRAPGALRMGLYLDICAGIPEFLVTPLLMGRSLS